jgi:hypothetical protein
VESSWNKRPFCQLRRVQKLRCGWCESIGDGFREDPDKLNRLRRLFANNTVEGNCGSHFPMPYDVLPAQRPAEIFKKFPGLELPAVDHRSAARWWIEREIPGVRG